jgi:hypothetical protein
MSGETCGCGNGRQGYASGSKNGWIDEHDVSHREERRYASQNLGAPVGAEMFEFKIAF